MDVETLLMLMEIKREDWRRKAQSHERLAKLAWDEYYSTTDTLSQVKSCMKVEPVPGKWIKTDIDLDGVSNLY